MGQYNNVLANDTYFVAVVKELYYMIFGWWISWANLDKANFILQFFAKLSFKIWFIRVEITPIQYILSRHVVLGQTQQSRNLGVHGPELLPKGLKSNFNHLEMVMRFFRTVHV
jgi:hypothetical protein